MEGGRQQGRPILCRRARVRGGRMASQGSDDEAASLPLSPRLASANFPPGFFTHVFIDEAGQAVEPESVVAIAGEWWPAAVSGTSIPAWPGDPPVPC